MNTRHRFALAAAVLTLAAAAVSACGKDDTGTAGPGPLPGLNATTPLKNTEWFTTNFGTPVVIPTAVTPRAVEQAKDLSGVVLPQNSAPVDGPVMWQRVRCEPLPFTTTDGPTSRRGDLLYGGYARTPLGAAMAAFHAASYGGYMGNPATLPLIAAPSDRDRLSSQMPLDAFRVPDSQFEPGCLATKKNLTRPAQWSAEKISDTIMRIGFYYPPKSGEARGYTYYLNVVWADDWYLSEQSVADITHIGGRERTRPEFADVPTGWTTW